MHTMKSSFMSRCTVSSRLAINSCVKGRGNDLFRSFKAMDCASASPISTEKRRLPPASCNTKPYAPLMCWLAISPTISNLISVVIALLSVCSDRGLPPYDCKYTHILFL